MVYKQTAIRKLKPNKREVEEALDDGENSAGCRVSTNRKIGEKRDF